MIWNEIVCLGDSLTYGARDEFGRSYPMELGKLLTKSTGEFYHCHNHGICRETSSDLLRRAWGNINSHPEARILLLMIGTNDTINGIPIDIYRDNVETIINIAKVHRQTVIVATLPKLEFTPLYLKNTDYILDYNAVINALSLSMNFEICNMSGMEKYYIDGVHFTHRGNLELAKRFGNIILGLQGK